ncbi:MAG: ribosome biogenesis GTP-binding protein YihA/YsxC [Deltaproteobacteria bacterium]|nr:ribosome biogenesis GTP-binding protein YihA/YsxC [Deltaproteobacteria bacterium]
MKVHDARFLLAATDSKSWPKEPLPEIAFAGRSNVGKSSLINALLGRKALAKTSSKPGKTRALGFIEIQAGSSRLRFCDLPGYGFAKVSKSERAAWGKMIERYVTERDDLRLVVCLVDARHPPSALDRQMIEWLTALGRPMQVVATKLDKLPRNKQATAVKKLKQELGLPVVGVSSEKGTGKDELWRVLAEATA